MAAGFTRFQRCLIRPESAFSLCVEAGSGGLIAAQGVSIKLSSFPMPNLVSVLWIQRENGVCAAIKQGPYNGLAVGRSNLEAAGISLLFPRTVIHPQFHPLEPEWIEFAADPAPRLHRMKRNGAMMECLHAHNNEEFVIHETFLGKTGDLVFVVWPHALRRMDWTTRKISTIADFNAWHIAPNKAGTQVLCDTNHPDRGIFMIDVATGDQQLVCLSESTNQGSQWAKSSYALTEDFAKARCDERYDNLSWMETHTDTVYGPQWTHPTRHFRRMKKLITFASDKTGHSQVYVAELEY